MNFERLKLALALNGQRIRELVGGVDAEQARWRPDGDSWSILEVVNHLYDEEREDFRVRLEIALFDPQRPWPPIDPQGWVTARRYNARDLAESVANFLVERQASLVWLDSLFEPDWDSVTPAPWGEIRAGDFFASWVAHDTLHMRQLVELHRAFLLAQIGGYDVRYAGDW